MKQQRIRKKTFMVNNNTKIILGIAQSPTNTFFFDIKGYYTILEEYDSKLSTTIQKQIKQFLYNKGYKSYIVDVQIPEMYPQMKQKSKHFLSIECSVLLDNRKFKLNDIKDEAYQLAFEILKKFISKQEKIMLLE